MKVVNEKKDEIFFSNCIVALNFYNLSVILTATYTINLNVTVHMIAIYIYQIPNI